MQNQGAAAFAAYLKRLQDQAEIDRVKRVDNSIRLETYLSSAQTLWLQTDACRLAEDWEALYVLLHRFSCLYINVLRKHNGAALKQYQKPMAECRSQAAAAIKEMEGLVQKQLQQRYQDLLAGHPVDTNRTAPEGPSLPSATDSSLASSKLHWEERVLPDAMETLSLKASTSAPTPALYPAGSDASPTALRPVLFPRELMTRFLTSAAPSLDRGVEWCGIIAGSLRGGTLTCSHILIPRQTGTPDTCNALNEVDLFEYQAAHELLTIGWIHTHPRMEAFLSSVDLHNHANYQSLLPEAIAVVCAPTGRPPYAILRICDAALPAVQRCTLSGFHEHFLPDGQKLHGLAELCTHVVEVDTAPYPLTLVDLQ